CLLLLRTIFSCSASVLSTSVGSVGVVAHAGCLPLAAADSLGTGAAVVIGVGVAIGGVREVSESPLFFLALAFGFGAATPVS
nr:hypothetical protein [Tanacetum cinerariifolium]